jgi:hypothetical protein
MKIRQNFGVFHLVGFRFSEDSSMCSFIWAESNPFTVGSAVGLVIGEAYTYNYTYT